MYHKQVEIVVLSTNKNTSSQNCGFSPLMIYTSVYEVQVLVILSVLKYDSHRVSVPLTSE